MKHIRFQTIALAGLLSAVAFSSAQAVIITDPTLHVYNAETSPSPIDPKNNVKVNAPGSTPKSAIYQLPRLGVIQDFTGFANGSNGIAFTDPNRADVRFSFGGSALVVGSAGNATGSALTNNSFLSSNGSGIRFAADNTVAAANTMTASIDFGKYSGTDFLTDSTPGVSAVAFTLNGQAGTTPSTNRFASVNSIVVSYYGADGVTLLSSQLVDSFTETGYYGLYFGYAAEAGDSISRVTIDVNIKSLETLPTRAQVILGIDDLGFTAAIPEPAHVGLILVAAMFGVALVRRRLR